MLVVGSLIAAPSSASAGPTPTFARDVAPILFKSCVECHRPSAMAPMSLMTYEDARPWARAIKLRVSKREMPPWGADQAYGRFANDPSLTPAQIDTIAAWVDGGAPEGNKADLPPAPTFTEGWSIGKPDYVFRMLAPFKVPADGTLPYFYVTIPTNLNEDIWIRGVELKPTDRRVVHHIISELVEGTGARPDASPKLTRDPGRKEIAGGLGAGFVPGRLYGLFDEGVARKIPAGADIVLQMHYTTIGVPVTDQTEVGVVLAKEPPSELRAQGGGQMPNLTFVIPPGAPNHEVSAQKTFDRDTYLNSLYPHMHMRGKDVTYTIVYPDGREEIVLRVPKYDFSWQNRYVLAEPKFVPKGATLKIVAHYDNSTGNRFNPDPTAEVRWGDQTWEEMLIGYYGTIDAPAKPRPTGQRP
ncbi:MAG: thiol-disulfide isomerase [Acidobacteria bacterium]|nr:thiol-disulfide isomerase [Acidobacteriota bacterium]